MKERQSQEETYVRDTNSLDLASLDKGFHLPPSLAVVPALDDISRAVGLLGESVVVALGVHEQGPVDEVQVDVVEAQGLQALLETLGDAGVVSSPDLADDEDVLALGGAAGEGLLETLADLVLVGVAVGAVDELVAVLEGVGDGGLDLAGLTLPGACRTLQ